MTETKKSHRGLKIAGGVTAGLLVLAAIGGMGEDAPAEPTARPAAETTTPEPEPTWAPQPEPAVEEPVAVPEAVDVDQVFVDHVRENTTWLFTTSDAELISTAHNVCGLYDQGLSTEEVVLGITMAAEGDQDIIKDLAVLSGAAVAAYCPEYGADIERAQGVGA